MICLFVSLLHSLPFSPPHHREQKSVVLYINGEMDAERPLDPALLSAIDDFNPSPLFVGQPPAYATVEKGAEGLLQGLVR